MTDHVDVDERFDRLPPRRVLEMMGLIEDTAAAVALTSRRVACVEQRLDALEARLGAAPPAAVRPLHLVDGEDGAG